MFLLSVILILGSTRADAYSDTDESYKELYKEYLSTANYSGTNKFALLDVDSNGIPELIIEDGCTAQTGYHAGYNVFTVNSDELITSGVIGSWGRIKYNPNNNVIISNPTGSYDYSIFKLDNYMIDTFLYLSDSGNDYLVGTDVYDCYSADSSIFNFYFNEYVTSAEEITFVDNTAANINEYFGSSDYVEDTGKFEATVSNESYDVGSIVCFGSYEQDNNLLDGTEAIQWEVLSNGDGKALLISRYALDLQPYNEDDEDVTWEDCTLREWLNVDFYNAAFSAEEKSRITTSYLTNDDNDYDESYRNRYHLPSVTEGGNDTQDKVFLLSINEVEKYYNLSEIETCLDELKTKPTVYAMSGGDALDEGYQTCWYWLRSPGGLGTYAAIIGVEGRIYCMGTGVSSDNIYVRPVICIETGDSNANSRQITSDPRNYVVNVYDVGNTVTFGRYEQDNNTENGPEDIEWIVLDKQDGKALLISKYLIEYLPYNDEEENITWENSSIRKWLGDDFYYSAFTSNEQGVIESTVLENQNNAHFGTYGGNETVDKVFLLSMI